MGKLIIPLGILTYTFLALTVCTGYMILKLHVKWVKMKHHIILGVLTIILASMHAGVIIFIKR